MISADSAIINILHWMVHTDESFNKECTFAFEDFHTIQNSTNGAKQIFDAFSA